MTHVRLQSVILSLLVGCAPDPSDSCPTCFETKNDRRSERAVDPVLQPSREEQADPVDTDRPFRKIVNAMLQRAEEEQGARLAALAMGLRSRTMAEYNHCEATPHLGHLIEELCRCNLLEPLRRLLRERRLSYCHYFEVALVLAESRDPATPDILLANSRWTSEVGWGRSACEIEEIRADSARALESYLNDPRYDRRVYCYLTFLLASDPSPQVRGEAALALSSSDRAEAAARLTEALDDNQFFFAPNGSPCDTVGTCAQSALEWRKFRNKPSPRVETDGP